MFAASGAVYAIWIAGLVVVVLVLPVLVCLLHRLWRDARHIERYAADALAAGLGIAGNTAAISALTQTIGTAGGMLKTAGAIDEHTAAIERLLAARASGPGGAR